MEKEQLSQLASDFREAIERLIKKRNDPYDMLLGFPRGKCGFVSSLFQRYLHEQFGEEVLYVTSSRDCPESHAWLETDKGIIIDITGDQYFDRENEFFYNIPVYVGTLDDFHKAFGKCKKSYYVEHGASPFRDDSSLKIDKTYETIIKEMSLMVETETDDK